MNIIEEAIKAQKEKLNKLIEEKNFTLLDESVQHQSRKLDNLISTLLYVKVNAK